MGFLQNNFIADFFALVLKFFYNNITHDYVLATILLVIVIKILMLPLDIKQRKSMAKVMAASEKVEKIKKRYPDPRVQQAKVSEYYKKENIKPMGGCLPMLLQLPIMLALYGCLKMLSDEQTALMVIEMNNTGGAVIDLPSWLWVHNMWRPDSPFSTTVLPNLTEWQNIMKALPEQLLTQVQNIDYEAVTAATTAQFANYNNGYGLFAVIQAGSMFLSQKLTPTQQAQPGAQSANSMMMVIMPLFSGYICLTVTAVFAVYWITNNIYTIIQSLILKKLIKPEPLSSEV
ncbi:MAG: membrane protein insertase YidC [Christensenellales bacterium]|jgi:YidC/Oxa1 family membrane protein insertase